jgi:hypothetical protein
VRTLLDFEQWPRWRRPGRRAQACWVWLGALLLTGPVAAVTTPDDIRPPTADPCVVTSPVVVSGSACPAAPVVLDFGSRAVVIGTASAPGSVDIGSGCAQIRARSLAVTAASGALLAPRGIIDIVVAEDAILDGVVQVGLPRNCGEFGKLDVTAGGTVRAGPTSTVCGSQIRLTAGADIVLEGLVSAHGMFSGFVYVRAAGSVRIQGPVDASATA